MEDGYYHGWAYFKITIKPSFSSVYTIDVELARWDNEQVKDIAENSLAIYIQDCYYDAIESI
jgi:hypothetical protein